MHSSENSNSFSRYLRNTGCVCVLFLAVQLCCLQYAHCGFKAIPVTGKPASQSTTFSDSYPASKAVDGSTGSYAHTSVSGDPHPWWLVDLGNEHCLGKITVTLRLDCCALRFIAAVARAGLSSNYADNLPCGSPATSAQSTDGAVVEFLCDTPRMTRYVSLDIDPSSPGVTDAVLQIAELAVEEHTTRACDTFRTKSTYFERLHKKGLIANANPLSTKEVRSLVHCASFCVKDSQCFSFDFGDQNSRLCHLYSLNSTDIEMTPSDDFSIYVLMNRYTE